MLEREEKEIDGHVYRFEPLKLKPARALFDLLMQRFGPAVANAIEGLEQAQGLDENLEVTEALGMLSGSFAGMVRGIVDGLDPKTHEKLADQLAEHIKVDMPSKPDDPYSEKVEMPLKAVREQLFARKLMTETKVIIFCLRAQFEDFLEPMRRLAATTVSLRAKAASSSDSQKESIGSSTASPPVTDTATA